MASSVPTIPMNKYSKKIAYSFRMLLAFNLKKNGLQTLADRHVTSVECTKQTRVPCAGRCL